MISTLLASPNTTSSIVPLLPQTPKQVLGHTLTGCNQDGAGFRLTGTGSQDASRARRLKRRIPAAHFEVASLTTPPALTTPSEVVSARIKTFHIRTKYELAEGFDSLAKVSRPGGQVAALIGRHYPGRGSWRLTQSERDTLQAVGSSFDSLSLFVPHVWILKSLGSAAALVAKTLRNETVTASDMLDVNGAYKGVADMTVQHSLLVRVGPDNAPASQTRPASIKALQAIPAFAPSLRGAPRLFAQHTVASPELPIVVDDAPIRREPARQVVQLTKIPAPPPPPPQPPPSLPQVPSPPKDATLPQSRFPGVSVSRFAQSEMLPRPNVAVSARAENIENGENVAAPERSENVEKDQRSIDRSASIVVPVQGARISDTLTPGRYVTIGRVPLLRQPNSAGQLEWQAPPLQWYRADIARPEGGLPLFTIGDEDYVSIDGGVYAARDVSEMSLEVFNPGDVALPPLPVEAQDGVWRFTKVKASDVEDLAVLRSVKPSVHSKDADGFIRINNKKYLMLRGKVIETDRSAIANEARIASSARRIMESLPTADAAGFIRWRDGQVVIEGRFGYYATRYDARLGMVVDDVAGTPVPVHYDARRAQWQVGAHPESAAWRQALYSRRPDLAKQEYPDVWESASAQSGSSSASAESLHDWSDAKDFPFVQHWPRLALALTKSFDRLSAMSLARPNRRSPTPISQHFNMVHSIDGIRRSAYRLMPDIDVWESASVLVKQKSAAAYTWDVYKGFHAMRVTLEMDLGVQAMCSEMTELMMVQASRHLRSGILPSLRRRNGGNAVFLEIQIKEQVPLGRTGRAHVALMAFKSTGGMEAGFGAVSRSPAASHAAYPPVLKEMSNIEFRAFAYQNRREILLIDAWGPRKIIDFAMAGGVDAAMSELLLNLKEARFGDFTERVGYSVQAFVPPRGGTARGTWVHSLEEEG